MTQGAGPPSQPLPCSGGTAGEAGNAQALRISLPTRRATIALGAHLGACLRAGDLVVLSGELGAGKTFLARSVARAMSVSPSVRITSPTFTLAHQYEARLPLVHADLYRVHDPCSLQELGLRELRADGAVVLVEWGEPFIAELGGDALVVRLQLAPRGRAAELLADGPEGVRLLEALRGAQLAAPPPRHP